MSTKDTKRAVWSSLSSKTPQSLVPIVMVHFSFNASLNRVDARGLGLGPTLPLLAMTGGIYLMTAILVWSARGWLTHRTQASHGEVLGTLLEP
jgi:hypothetical protein